MTTLIVNLYYIIKYFTCSFIKNALQAYIILISYICKYYLAKINIKKKI